MLKVYASCFSIASVMRTRGARLLRGIYNWEDQRKYQYLSLLLFFGSSLCCEIKISGGVSCNYEHFQEMIFSAKLN